MYFFGSRHIECTYDASICDVKRVMTLLRKIFFNQIIYQTMSIIYIENYHKDGLEVPHFLLKKNNLLIIKGPV